MAVVSADKFYIVSNHLRSYLGTLRCKKVRSHNYDWRFIEGGNPSRPTIVFVHGFMGSKSLWRSLMQHLVSDYHVIAVDLPGLHMGMATVEGRYDFPVLSDTLNEFICAMKLSHFHLVGHSLGANVCAVYAARYKDRITTLALISLLATTAERGAGQLSRFSEFRQHLMCRDLGGLKRLLEMLYLNPPTAPAILLQHKLKELNQHRQSLLSALQDMEHGMLFLIGCLKYLPDRTLLINGSDDVFYSPESVSLLRDNVRGLLVNDLKDCGHLPFLEKPKLLADTYRGYLIKQCTDNIASRDISTESVAYESK